MNAAQQRRDYGFIAIVILVAITTVWLLLMPWVTAIASATLNRFHLRSSSFVTWAIQFPIPSMYNFANRFRVTDVPPGLIDPILENPLADDLANRYINHFPSRVFTFADLRHLYLKDGRDRWLTIQSSYRGQQVETRMHAKPDGEGGFVLLRIPDQSQ